MEGFLESMGSAAVRFSLKALVTVCTGILAVIETVSGKRRKRGENNMQANAETMFYESLFAKTVDGNTMIDKAYQMVTAA